MLHQWETRDVLGFVGTQLLRRSSEWGGGVLFAPLHFVVAPRFVAVEKKISVLCR